MSHLDEIKLFSYIDNECSPTEREAIEHHLAACPACSSLHKELASLDSLLMATKPLEPSTEFTDVLMSKLQVSPAPRVYGLLPSLLSTGQLMGLVLVLALLTLVYVVPGLGITTLNSLGSINLLSGLIDSQHLQQSLLQTSNSNTLSVFLTACYSMVGLLLLDKVFQKYLLPRLAL